MSEEIDKRIERAIKSVAPKKALMDRWKTEWDENVKVAARCATEAPPSPKLWRRRGFRISAAASVIIILGAGISYFMLTRNDSGHSVPVAISGEQGNRMPGSEIVFRGGDTDFSAIAEKIDRAEYDTALAMINRALADTVIDPSLPPERQEYQRSLAEEQRYELLWLKINALYRSGKKNEARTLLKPYAETEGQHQQQAKELLISTEK